MKQTAVEYLLSYLPQIDYGNDPYYDEIIKQAKELEREQIEDAYRDSRYSLISKEDAEQYYDETYKNERDN